MYNIKFEFEWEIVLLIFGQETTYCVTSQRMIYASQSNKIDDIQ